MDQLDRIERMLHRLTEALASTMKVMPTEEAMEALGCESRTTFYRVLKGHGVHPIRRGFYDRAQITSLTQSHPPLPEAGSQLRIASGDENQ